MKILDELYSGKAKSVFKTDDQDRLVLRFRDDTSAFDGEKKASLARKGAVNNRFNAFIMSKLEQAGIATHFEKLFSDNESLVKRLEMIPVECVVRNIAAGSICRRLGVKEGLDLNPPTFEFFLKNDALHEYYNPDTGEPIMNKGFQNWNYLVMNMIAWMEAKPVIEEF